MPALSQETHPPAKLNHRLGSPGFCALGIHQVLNLLIRTLNARHRRVDYLLWGCLKQTASVAWQLRTFRLDVCETFARYRFRALRRAARINCSDDHYRTTDLFNRQTGFL